MRELIDLVFYIMSLCIISMWLSACSNSIPNGLYISNIDDSRMNNCNLKLENNQQENKKSVDNYNITSSVLTPVNIVRNYNNIIKGSYSGLFYIVNAGDTLFYIAWITGYDYRVLAKINNINIHDLLKVGQILYVGHENKYLYNKQLISNIKNNIKKVQNTNNNASSFSVVVSELNELSNINSICDCDNHINRKDNNTSEKVSQLGKNSILNTSFNQDNCISELKNSDFCCIKENQSAILWKWPTHGKIINYFSSDEGGNKGLDISGLFGQDVVAASNGRVVYAGNALTGYGNLVIIKHDCNFVSTYAHNDKILVHEHQNVRIGQKIATMGDTESDTIKLHFEIRYKGRSVNPLCYLPKK